MERKSMLTLPYSISGVVVKGSQKAGSLGYPTANLPVDPKLDLPHGVYLGYSMLSEDRKNLPSIIFYGTPYTLGEFVSPRFEVHILGQRGLSLYNKNMQVTCETRLRANKKFPTNEELHEAILEDVRQAKKYFSLDE